MLSVMERTMLLFQILRLWTIPMKEQYFLVILLCYAVQGSLSKFWVSLLYSIKVWQSEIHPSGHSTQLQIFIERIAPFLVKSLKNLLAFDNRPVVCEMF